MVKAYLLYTFAFVGIATLIGFFLFKVEQTKAEIMKHLILGMVMSIAVMILDGNKLEEKLSWDQTEFE